MVLRAVRRLTLGPATLLADCRTFMGTEIAWGDIATAVGGQTATTQAVTAFRWDVSE
jgi:hypothetical protein